MSAPLKTTLSSRLEMWKLLQNGSWFPGGIYWSCIFPLDEHFLDGSLTQATLTLVKMASGCSQMDPSSTNLGRLV